MCIARPNFEITKKAAGVSLDKVLIESIRFKINRTKLYVYDTDELTREEIQHELEEKAKNDEKEEKLREEAIEKANNTLKEVKKAIGIDYFE